MAAIIKIIMIITVCKKPSGTLFLHGCTLGAVLEYRTGENLNGEIIITQTYKLESFYPGEICE